MAIQQVVRSLRQPEYTGENRCIACTAVNLALALGLGLLFSTLSSLVGGVVFLVATSTIYLRGYLVPGTPQLTKQYMPEPVLSLFGKRERKERTTSVDEETIPETTERLHRVGIVRECADRDDLCLDQSFQNEWYGQIRAIRDGDDLAGSFATALGLSRAALEIDEKEGVYFGTLGGTQIGQWNSEAAVVGDVAAAQILDGWLDGWEHMDTETQGATLATLRLFLERCPSCGNEVAVEEGSVDSCCFSQNVLSVQCSDCDSVLFQTNAF